MIISYIQIIEYIKLFSDNHLQIKKFSTDFVSELNNFATITEEYPLLWMSLQNTIVKEFTKEFTLTFYCFDVIQQGRDNINTILSDTELILNDLFIWIKDGNMELTILNNAYITPLNNSLLDYCSGHQMTMTIEADLYTNCDIPFMNSIPQPNPQNCGSVFIENSDGTYSRIIECGENFELEDIKITINGGQELFKPSNQDLDFTNYYFLNSNTSTKYPAPLPLSNQDQVGWFNLSNDPDPQVIFGDGIITKSGDNTLNNGAGKFLINIFEDFELNFTLSLRGSGFGFTYYNGTKYGLVQDLIDYSLYKGTNTGVINVGVRGTTVFTYNITAGETNCKIKRNGFQIEFYVENVLIYTAYAIPSTDIFSQGYVYGQAAIRLTGQYIKNISFTGDFNLPNPNLLEWQMTFYNTNDINIIEATSDNIGTFTLDEKDNVGDITISTDNVTYNTITFPFTPTDGNTYFFKRSDVSSTGKYKLIGEQ